MAALDLHGLVPDVKGRLVSPWEPMLDDVTPDPLPEEELLTFVRLGTKLPAGTTVIVPPGTNPVNAEPLNFACNAGWTSNDMVLLAKALDKDKDPVVVQSQLNRMLAVQAERNCPELCRALIAAGASPTSTRAPMQPQAGDWTVGGVTPLHLACCSGSVEAAEALVAEGSEVLAEDDAGDTPFDHAMHIAVVECGWNGGDGLLTASTAVSSLMASAGSELATEEEPVPYGGDIQAAMKAGDRNAIRIIMGAKKKKGAPPHPGIVRRLRCAQLLHPDRILPTAEHIRDRVKASKATARLLGPQKELARRQERAALLRQELESPPPTLGSDGEGQSHLLRVLFSPAKGCLWDHHWYVHTARAIKARASTSVMSCSLQWIHTLSGFEDGEKTQEEKAADRAAGGWKARHLSEVMVGGSGREGDHCIVVGHSSGGNAALRLAERQQVGTLLVIGAGNSAEDYASDSAARELAATAGVEPDPDAIIIPFDFRAIVRNVIVSIVVVHGESDDVILPSEATQILEGLQGAAADLIEAAKPDSSFSPPELQLRLEPGAGHFMEKTAAVIEEEIMRAVERHSRSVA